VLDRAESGEEEVKRSKEIGRSVGDVVVTTPECQCLNSATFMLSIACHSERTGGMPTHIYAL
jgi:hypothetical protein